MYSAQKKLMYAVGKKSLEFIPSDADVIVFGAGRTVCQALQAFFDLGMHNKMKVVCGTDGTERFAKELGVNTATLADLNGVKYVYIDGADQIDPAKNLIKGGDKKTGDPGLEGCMFKEKKLAYDSGTFIIIADISKKVDYIGQDNYGLPVEILNAKEEDAKLYFASLKLGMNLKKRWNPKTKALFETEGGNHIYDITFDGQTFDLVMLEESLEEHPAIVSTGLFAVRKPDIILISSPPDNIEVIN